jgi:hypothetical protein
VLQNQETAARLEHPVHFPHGLGDLLDAAQRKGADDAIEGGVLEGEPFAAEYPPVNLDARLLDAPACPAVHPDVRIDGRELADVGRVAGQVQAGAEADFQKGAAGVGEQFSAIPGHERSVQPEIAEQRDDHLRIEAHGRLLGTRHGPVLA